jgi:hypothetical protein
MKSVDDVVNCCLPCVFIDVWIRRVFDFLDESLRFMHVVGDCVLGLRNHSADMVVPGGRVKKVVLLRYKLIGDASGACISGVRGAAGPDSIVEGLAPLVRPGLDGAKAQVLQRAHAVCCTIVELVLVDVGPAAGVNEAVGVWPTWSINAH